MNFNKRSIISWILVLMISISPVSWSFAYDPVNPLDSMSMDMSHKAICVTMMDGADGKSCKMDHESRCKSCCNCVSQVNFPAFQTNNLFQWSSTLSTGTRFNDTDVAVISYYPELLKRPPIG